MKLKKPKFWNYSKPNLIAYLLLPFSILLQIFKSFQKKEGRNFKIKTICVGNIYIGGTGKTSLCIKVNEFLSKKNIKSCFVKKYYKDQVDEQKLLQNKSEIFISKNRIDALHNAEMKGYDVAILDDGLQDSSINCDINFVCFNNINWIGNGLTIPSGPLRENVNNLKKYNHIFLNGNSENLESITKKINEINLNSIIHIGEYIPLNIDEFDKEDSYVVFSGIGNHDTFISMIKKYKLNIVKEFEYPDHYNYSKDEINKICKEAENLKCKIITTEKDFLRIDKNKINIDKIKYIKSSLKIINEEKLINTLAEI